MNVLLKEREVAYYLGDSGADVLIAWHTFVEAAHAGADHTGAECVLVEPGDFETPLDRWPPSATATQATPRSSSTPPGRPARRGEPSSPTTQL